MLKKYLEMKQKVAEVEQEMKGGDSVQVTLDGATEEEITDDLDSIKYGNGVKVSTRDLSEALAEELQKEADRMTAERQAAVCLTGSEEP